jgi:hypothetical protein
MKIEANPTPAHLKWIVVAVLVAAGVGHEELMLMVGL